MCCKAFQTLDRSVSRGSYHPAIKYFIVVNEPELKLPSLNEPRKFAKAIVTAIDAQRYFNWLHKVFQEMCQIEG